MDAHVAATVAMMALQLFFDEEEDDEDKNYMRRMRKNLRDFSDPFSVPATEFISLYRLPKEFVLDVVIPRLRRHLEPAGINPSAVPLNLVVSKTL